MAYLDTTVQDDPLVSDGDVSFVGGQVSATTPERLPKQTVAEAVNMDINASGGLVTRRGAKTLVGNVVTSNWEDIATNWNSITAVFGSSLAATAVDAATYFDTGVNEYMIVAQGGALLSGSETAVFSAIAGSSYSGSNVWFANLANRSYYCDGTNALKYVDSSVANNAITAGKVTSITITEPGSGYVAVPSITFSSGSATATAILGYGGRVVSASISGAGSGYSATTPPTITFTAAPAGGTTALGRVNISQVPSKPKLLISHTNRLFCASADTGIPADTVYVSDILDGESWDLAGNSIRVGGDGDSITGLFSWYGNYLLVFKERSIWMVDADPLTDVANWTIRLVNNRIGCISDRSIQPVSKDVFFLSRDGVRRLSNIESGTQTEVGLAISTDIQDIIDDINPSATGTISSAFYRNRYMLALPTGSATAPDKVVVFSAIHNRWLGYWSGWSPRQFLVTAFSGKVRLNFADAGGNFWTWDDFTPESDETSGEYRDGTTDYASYVTTRAFDLGEPITEKLGYTVEVQTENRLPDANVTAYVSYDKDITGTFNSIDSAVTLTASTRKVRKSWNLISKGKFTVIQFKVGTTRHKLVLHGVAVTGFSDAIRPEID